MSNPYEAAISKMNRLILFYGENEGLTAWLELRPILETAGDEKADPVKTLAILIENGDLRKELEKFQPLIEAARKVDKERARIALTWLPMGDPHKQVMLKLIAAIPEEK